MPPRPAVVGDNSVSLNQRLDRIATCWQTASNTYVDGILQVGQELIDAQAEHGESLKEMADKLPFSWETARQLMRISQFFAPKIADNPGCHASLPPSWRTLFELTKLPDTVLSAALIDGRINQAMTREVAIELNPHALAETIRGVRVKVPDGKTLSEWARVGLALEENEGLAYDQVAARVGLSKLTYHHARDIVILADHPGLDKIDAAQCRSALVLMDEARVIGKPYDMVKAIALKVWGNKRSHTAMSAKRLTEGFEQSVNVICQACHSELTIPQLDQPKANALLEDLVSAHKALLKLIGRLREKTQ